MRIVEHFLPGRDEIPFSIAAREPDILFSVLRPGISLAIWHRAPHETVLDDVLAAAPFCACAEDHFEDAVARTLATLPAALPPVLADDMRRLAALFTLIAGSTRLGIRLETLDDDGCPFFHADAVGLRLLCTYAGPGTEWLPLGGGQQAARQLDRTRDHTPNAIATGAVALLKGEAFPGHRGMGCIHRSPPTAGRNTPRLLLCIDEPGRISLS